MPSSSQPAPSPASIIPPPWSPRSTPSSHAGQAGPPVWHSSRGLPGGLISDCGQQGFPCRSICSNFMPPGPPPAAPRPSLRPQPAPRPHPVGQATGAATLTEGAGPGPPTWPGRSPATDLGQARAAASSECPAGSSCAALEWAEWRTSPRSWGAPQANQERLSRYKASQSGGSAPFPHSLPSQIVTMGTITKKTAPKCNHFPVNFYPSAPPPLDLGSLVS